MKRTVVNLPDEVYEGLAKLAIENNTSVAELIRKAVEAVYRDDIGNLQDFGEEISGSWKPGPSIDLSKYMADRGLN
jgi:predicted DNA-binding protein